MNPLLRTFRFPDNIIPTIVNGTIDDVYYDDSVELVNKMRELKQNSLLKNARLQYVDIKNENYAFLDGEIQVNCTVEGIDFILERKNILHHREG